MKKLTSVVAALVLSVVSSGVCGTAKPLSAVVPPAALEELVVTGTVLTSSVKGSAYQWRKDGVPLVGGTSSTISVVPQKGLVGVYYNDPELHHPVSLRVDAQVGFIWWSKSPMPGVINHDNFSVVWDGSIKSPVTGPVVLYVQMDDGARLLVDDKVVAESWKEGPRREVMVRLDMVAGVERKIVLKYATLVNNASCQLFWQYGPYPKTLVPSNALSANVSGWYDCLVTTPMGVVTTVKVKVTIK